MPSIAILGSGNGSNAQALINAVEAGTLEMTIACIISDVQNAPILERAKQHHIPAHYIDCAPSPYALRDQAEATVLQLLEHYQVDYIILAGFMRIVKKAYSTPFREKSSTFTPLSCPLSQVSRQDGRRLKQVFSKRAALFITSMRESIPVKSFFKKKFLLNPTDTLESLMQKMHAAEHIAYPEALRRILCPEIQ